MASEQRKEKWWKNWIETATGRRVTWEEIETTRRELQKSTFEIWGRTYTYEEIKRMIEGETEKEKNFDKATTKMKQRVHIAISSAMHSNFGKDSSTSTSANEEEEEEEEEKRKELERKSRIEAYERALRGGAMDIAYSRVLFLGTSGVGITSFKRSLLNLPNTTTGVSDNSQLRTFTHEWHTVKENQFRVVSHEDDIEELAGLILKVDKNVPDTSDNKSDDSVPDEIAAQVQKIIFEVMSYIEKFIFSDKLKPQPFLHFWDCGGQPPFLEILPVFLTSRTLFFLIFNAKSLDHEGVPMTTLDYMFNWMANIHGHLMAYDEKGDFCAFPRMYCIGTDGDRVEGSRKSEIKKELEQQYQSKDFRALIEGTVIVGNTISGQDVAKDPSLRALRDAVVRFTEEALKKKTPLSWILFRKVIQAMRKKYNVISLKDARIIGAASNISREDVPHVLTFYHELGVLLFYPQIDGMKDMIILDPNYFVEALGELFSLRENPRYHKEWKLFHECGILVQPLYVELWKKYKDISPEIFIKVLVHFCIVVEVKTDKYPPPSKQYFMPVILKSTQVNRSSMTLPSDSNQAAPLHITFDSGYVPPGFFTRFVVLLANTGKMKLGFEKDVYRNRVTFRYQAPNSDGIEHIIITDCTDLIQINVQHYPSLDQEVVPFTEICQDIRVLLEKVASKIKKISKKCASKWTFDNESREYYRYTHKFKHICTSCSTTTPHYITLPPTTLTQNSQVFCDKSTDVYRPLTEREKVWFKDTSQSKRRTKEEVLTSSDESHAKLLGISDLDNVIDELQSIDCTKWKTLGVHLGLYHTTLEAIKADNGSVKDCLMECMAAWLRGEDKVREKGGHIWSSLATALEKIGENDIASDIRAKYCRP